MHFDEGSGREMRGQSIEVTFKPPTLIPLPAGAPAGAKRRYTSAQLDHVSAKGAVKLTESAGAEGGEGNNIQADRLETDMGLTTEGKPYPIRAVATGHVRARQDCYLIETESLIVEFAESTPEAIAAGERPYEAVLLKAAEGVTLHDVRPDVRMDVKGDTLVSYPKKQTATVTGDPARVAYGDEVLMGPKIVMLFKEGIKDAPSPADRKRRLVEAYIPGRGGVRALVTRDINGRQLLKPRPALIRWTESMRYLTEEDRLIFTKGVEFDSADGLAADPMGKPINFDSIGEHLRCGKMTVTLEKLPAPATRPASRPATRPAATPGAERTGISQMDRRKIQQIVAEKDVKVMSRWHDKQGFLEGQLQIAAERKLTYNALDKGLDVDGPGTLLVGDYRRPELPKPRKPGDPPPNIADAQNIGRPSQTVFKWGKNMAMSQTDWTVDFTGGVVMRHRSGKSILLAGNLPIRRISSSNKGRQIVLDCRHLNATFSKKPDKKPPATGTPGRGAGAPGRGAGTPGSGAGTSGRGATTPTGTAGTASATAGTAAATAEKAGESRFQNPGLTLETFVAEGGVDEPGADPNDPTAGTLLFQDGPYMAMGKRMEYSRKHDRVIIYGDPAKRIDARVYVEDPIAGTARWHTGQQITVTRRGGKIFITTGAGTGGGSGRN